MDVNLILVIIIAVVMALISGFFDALVKAVTTGIYDYGYLISLFIYSVIVGVIGGMTGILNLNMPLSEWWAVLTTQFAFYFTYLGIMHAVADYIILKLFPNAPQGLATPFLKPGTIAMLRK